MTYEIRPPIWQDFYIIVAMGDTKGHAEIEITSSRELAEFHAEDFLIQLTDAEGERLAALTKELMAGKRIFLDGWNIMVTSNSIEVDSEDLHEPGLMPLPQ